MINSILRHEFAALLFSKPVPRLKPPFYAGIYGIVTAIFICAALPAGAQTEAPVTEQPVKKNIFANYALSVSTTAGLWVGQSEEIVYQDTNSNEYISQLIWDMKPLAKIGLTLELGPDNNIMRKGVFFIVNAQFAMPNTSGIMLDRDWDPEYWDFPGQLTNRSEHTNRTRSAFLAELRSGWNFPVKSKMSFRPYLNFAYQYFSFSGQDGYREYKAENNWEHIEMYGEVITFTQIFYMLSAGCSFYYPIHEKIGIEAFAQAGYVILYGDEDNHLERGLQFIDFATRGLELQGGVQAKILPFNRIGFDIGASYKNVSNVRGMVSKRDVFSGTVRNFSNVCGAALSLFDISARMIIRW